MRRSNRAAEQFLNLLCSLTDTVTISERHVLNKQRFAESELLAICPASVLAGHNEVWLGYYEFVTDETRGVGWGNDSTHYGLTWRAADAGEYVAI